VKPSYQPQIWLITWIMLVLLIVEEIPTQMLRELGGDSHGKFHTSDDGGDGMLQLHASTAGKGSNQRWIAKPGTQQRATQAKRVN